VRTVRLELVLGTIAAFALLGVLSLTAGLDVAGWGVGLAAAWTTTALLGVARARRGEPNVLLVHYDSLSADLEGQMRWLAGQLGIAVPQEAWPALVRAAAFENMRDSADTLVPTAGILKSNTAFFRRGTSGAGREILGGEELAAYYARAAQLAPPDMLTWLHSSHQSL